MAVYTNITLAEMDAALSADKGWTREAAQVGRTREYVYSFALRGAVGVTVKVYSSLHVNTDVARGVGQDAIRVCAILTYPSGKTVGYVKAARVHRVGGWRENLRARVLQVIEAAKARASTEAPRAAPVNAPASPVARVPTQITGWDAARRFRAAEGAAEIELADALRGYTGNDEFLGSLAASLRRFGRLSPRQWEAGLAAYGRFLAAWEQVANNVPARPFGHGVLTPVTVTGCPFR